MTKERIEIIRQSLIPFVKNKLLEINYEGLGKSDAKEFEKDLNEVLDLAIKALEQQPSDDCVSREQALLQLTGVNLSDKTTEELIKLFSGRIKSLPPVTPTHGSCKDCEQSECLGEECYCNNVDEYFDKDFYCADFEKRGSENGI